MKFQLKFLQLLAGFFLITFACGSAFSQVFEPSTRSVCEYGRGEALTDAVVKRGTIVHVSNVSIGAASSTSALGGVVGGSVVLASTAGKDIGTRAALTALGTAAGVKVAERVGQSEGIRFLVEDKQGNITALVAEADNCARTLQKGDSVFVALGSRTRIIRD